MGTSFSTESSLNSDNAVWLQGEYQGIWIPALNQTLVKCDFFPDKIDFGYVRGYVRVYLENNKNFNVEFFSNMNMVNRMQDEIKRFKKAWENFQTRTRVNEEGIGTNEEGTGTNEEGTGVNEEGTEKNNQNPQYPQYIPVEGECTE